MPLMQEEWTLVDEVVLAQVAPSVLVSGSFGSAQNPLTIGSDRNTTSISRQLRPQRYRHVGIHRRNGLWNGYGHWAHGLMDCFSGAGTCGMGMGRW